MFRKRRSEQLARAIVAEFGTGLDQSDMYSCRRGFDYCVKFTWEGLQIEAWVGSPFLEFEVKNFWNTLGCCLSVNEPSFEAGAMELVSNPFSQFEAPVYSVSTPGAAEAAKRFCLENETLIAALDLRKQERFSISAGWMILHTSYEDSQQLRNQFNALHSLFHTHYTEPKWFFDDFVTSRYAYIEGVSLEPEKLPTNLRPLLEHAKKWAIGDDVERSQLIAETPLEEKKVFVDAVDSVAGEIHEWVLQHQDEIPVPDEVVMFQMMGEAATEAYYDVCPGTPLDSTEIEQHHPNLARRSSRSVVLLFMGFAAILALMIGTCRR